MGKRGRKGKRRKLAEGLFKQLTNDILKRHDKEEYWGAESSSNKTIRRKEILMRFNNSEYWDMKIIEDFQTKHNLDEQQIGDIMKCITNELQGG